MVRNAGEVGNVTVLAEAPAAEGFAGAVRACLARQRFRPGLDRSGRAVASIATLQTHFER